MNFAWANKEGLSIIFKLTFPLLVLESRTYSLSKPHFLSVVADDFSIETAYKILIFDRKNLDYIFAS